MDRAALKCSCGFSYFQENYCQSCISATPLVASFVSLTLQPWIASKYFKMLCRPRYAELELYVGSYMHAIADSKKQYVEMKFD